MRRGTLGHSRLSDEQTRRLLEHFVAGTPARTTAQLVQVNRNTATYFFHRLREIIAAQLAKVAPSDDNLELEIQSSHPNRVRNSQNGRSANGEPRVLSVLARGGKVHMIMVPDTRKETLLPILRGAINPQSMVYASAPQVSDGLEHLGIRYRTVDDKDRFAAGAIHLNGIENFWNQSKRHLRKYNGIPAHHLHLYLKECEWRYNYGPAARMLKTLEGWLAHS